MLYTVDDIRHVVDENLENGGYQLTSELMGGVVYLVLDALAVCYQLLDKFLLKMKDGCRRANRNKVDKSLMPLTISWKKLLDTISITPFVFGLAQ